MTTTIDRDDAIDVMRDAVLLAMDQAAFKLFRDSTPERRAIGASNSDLAHIFPAINSQVDRLADRYGVTFAAEAARRERATKAAEAVNAYAEAVKGLWDLYEAHPELNAEQPNGAAYVYPASLDEYWRTVIAFREQWRALARGEEPQVYND